MQAADTPKSGEAEFLAGDPTESTACWKFKRMQADIPGLQQK